MTVLCDRKCSAQGAVKAGNGHWQADTRVPPRPETVLRAVSVNGTVIPEAEILSEAQNHPAETPTAALLAAAKALVVRQLLLDRAKILGLSVVPLRDQSGRLETAEDAAIRALLDRELDTPQAREEECLRYYKRNPLRTEPLYEARHILIAADPADANARAKARRQAERLIESLSARPDAFAAIAADYSACPSAQQGGTLGQLSRGSTVPEFEAALATLREGETTRDPVESPYGLHIIRLDRKIGGHILPFDQVKERIAAWLDAGAWSKGVSQYIALLASEAVITGIDLGDAEGLLGHL